MQSNRFILTLLSALSSLAYVIAPILADETKSSDASTATSATKVKAASGLSVKFSLNRPEASQYRRPYVAVWLEDSESYPVKTVVLWLQKEQPGPRWHRDLTRWYRNDRLRKVAEKKDLIDGITSPTRGPGDYEAHFDGTDNQGQRLKPGKYKLFLEVAREHGTYQLVRHDFTWSDQPFEELSIPGNVEISNIAISFTPPAESRE